MHNVEATFVLPLLRLRYKVLSTSHGAAQMLDKWNGIAKFFLRLSEWPFIYLSNSMTSVSKPLADYYQTSYKRPVRYLPNGVNLDNPVDEEAAQSLLAEHNLGAKQVHSFRCRPHDQDQGMSLFTRGVSHDRYGLKTGRHRRYVGVSRL